VKSCPSGQVAPIARHRARLVLPDQHRRPPRSPDVADLQAGTGCDLEESMQTQPNDLLDQLSTGLAAAIERVGPSLIHVSRRRGGGGTGIAWTEELVVTSSFHVPDDPELGVVAADGSLTRRAATVVGRDPGTDVAVLRVAGAGLAPASFRELDGLAVGQFAIALGRPGRTARASLRIVGVLGPEIRTPAGGRLDRYVETDRAIPRGFAGGPLIDTAGRVIGMNTRTAVRGADLAIPTLTLRRIVDEIVAHGGVRRGYLGVGAYPVGLGTADAQALGQRSGALIASVEDGGPAATAGILVGDILTRIAGVPIGDPDDLRAALWDRGGQTVDADLVRAGARQAMTVTIGTRP
jgi:S1-C subfamily serine protease